MTTSVCFSSAAAPGCGSQRWRLALVVLLLLCPGCLWRGYDRMMNIHLDVLTHTAAKLVLVVESGRDPGTDGMAEYVYPAQRARQFLRQFESRRKQVSYQELTKLLDRYEAFVKAVGAARAAPQHAALTKEWLHGERDAIWAQATNIRAAIEAGR